MARLAEYRSQLAADNDGVDPYADLSDQQFADRLYQAHYADIPRTEFDQKIGYTNPTTLARGTDTAQPPVERTKNTMSNVVGALTDPEFWSDVGSNAKQLFTGKPGEPSWGEVLSEVPTQVAAKATALKSAPMEFSGGRIYDAAHKRMWQAIVLPGVMQDLQNKRAETGKDVYPTEDSEVIRAAQRLGMRPDQFMQGWQDVVNTTPQQQQEIIQQSMREMEAGEKRRLSGEQTRKTAAAVAELYAPELPDWSAKNLVFQGLSSAPEMLVSVGAGLVAGPAAGVGTMGALVAPQYWSSAKNQGASDAQANLYAVLNTAAEVAPELPVMEALTHSPTGKRIIRRIAGKLADTTGGKIAGTAAIEGLSESITQALNIAVDAGVLDKHVSLPEALNQIAQAGVVGVGMGASVAGVTEGTRSLAERSTQPPAQQSFTGEEGEAIQPAPQAEAPEPSVSSAVSAESAEPTATDETPIPQRASASLEALEAVRDGTASQEQVQQAQSAGFANEDGALLPAGRRELVQQQRKTLFEAARDAAKEDVTIKPSEDGYTVHVKGEPTVTFQTIERAREEANTLKKAIQTGTLPKPSEFSAAPAPAKTNADIQREMMAEAQARRQAKAIAETPQELSADATEVQQPSTEVKAAETVQPKNETLEPIAETKPAIPETKDQAAVKKYLSKYEPIAPHELADAEIDDRIEMLSRALKQAEANEPSVEEPKEKYGSQPALSSDSAALKDELAKLTAEKERRAIEEGKPVYLGKELPMHKRAVVAIKQALTKWRNKDQRGKAIAFMPTSDALRSLALEHAGLKLENYSHAIDTSAINHVFKKHGTAQEIARGQIPIQEKDFHLIPKVIDQPDYLVFGAKTEQGHDAISYLKRMPDGHMVYVEEKRSSNNHLALQTMWRSPGRFDAKSPEQNVRNVFRGRHTAPDKAGKLTIVDAKTGRKLDLTALSGRLDKSALEAIDKYKDRKQQSIEEPRKPYQAASQTIDIDGIKRSTVNSSGRPIAPTEEGIKNFWKWFSPSLGQESKVVDVGGKPLVVYHGTNQNITSFDPSRLGRNTNSISSREGFFFTEDAAEAGDYANLSARKQVSNAPEAEANAARLLREIERAQRRRDFDLEEKLTLELEESEREAMTGEERGANILPVYLSIKNPLVMNFGGGVDLAKMALAIKKAKQAGHDGLRLDNVFDAVADREGLRSTTQWVAFAPTQIKSAIANRGTFDPSGSSIVAEPKQAYAAAPFYSALSRAAENVKLQKGTAEQWLATLKNTPGIKADEIEATDLEQFLGDRKGITKQEVTDYLKNNGVQITEKQLRQSHQYPHTTAEEWERAIARAERAGDFDEVERLTRAQEGPDEETGSTLGQTKFSQYVTPGGEPGTYRELLLTLPGRLDKTKLPNGFMLKPGSLRKWEVYRADHPERGRYAHGETQEEAIRNFHATHPAADTFKSPHWSEPNVIAHLRFDTRTDADGKKVMHIAEVQSDFGAATRKSKLQIIKAVKADFSGIVERMKADGVLKVECD